MFAINNKNEDSFNKTSTPNSNLDKYLNKN
jgi:hypothetical protein